MLTTTMTIVAGKKKMTPTQLRRRESVTEKENFCCALQLTTLHRLQYSWVMVCLSLLCLHQMLFYLSQSLPSVVAIQKHRLINSSVYSLLGRHAGTYHLDCLGCSYCSSIHCVSWAHCCYLESFSSTKAHAGSRSCSG